MFFFILTLLKKSIPEEFIKFSKEFGLKDVSSAALSKARVKISPQAFIHLNDELIKDFYTDNSVKTFYGFILFAIDGSTLQLPISQEIIEKYGCCSNQTDKRMPMAQISYLYDVVNDIVIHALMQPYSSDEREIAYTHIEKLISLLPISVKNKILLVFDRGYPSADFCMFLHKHGINFIIRCPTNTIREINEAVALGKRDTIVELTDRRRKTDKHISVVRKAIYKYFPGIQEGIRFRVIVIYLENGEIEILVTSLIDKLKHPYNIFSELYFKRWGIEGVFLFHKSKVEIENFSGLSCMAIEQDFHALILSTNARALLALEAQEEIEEELKPSKRKYDYQINKAISMNIWKEAFINMLMTEESNVEAFCIDTKNTMKKHLVPIRPGRKQKRIIKHTRKKYSMNYRS